MRRVLALWVVGVAILPMQAQAQSDFDLGRLQVPPGFLDLSDVAISVDQDHTITMTAKTTLMNADTYVLLSSLPAEGGKRRLILGLKPDDWSLTESIPSLDLPALDGLTLSHVGLVLTSDDVRMASSQLPEQDRWFYQEVYGSDEFTLVLKPGINLISAIPVADLEEGHPLLFVMDALGIEKGVVLLQGTLGKSLALIGSPSGSRGNILEDLFLRAELPPMRPPISPPWFLGGQLALELSGVPSLALAGEMTVLIEETELTFRLATTLAKTGISLSGGLKTDEPWESPFGIDWLIFNGATLMVGVTPTGSITLGFAGDMVIGEKDIRTAVMVAINSFTGVPTNFIFDGESEEGVAFSDLVEVQQRMAAARRRAQAAVGGEPKESRIPLDRLPDMAIQSMALKFAPKDSPELGVERGFRVAGDLLLAKPGGTPEKFAAVDVGVGDMSIWAKGELGAFTLGPLVWQDAMLDIELSAETQHFMVKGEAAFLGASRMLDVSVSREGFSFKSERRLYDLFTAELAAESVFDLKAPAFKVDAKVQNDFADAVVPLITNGLVRFAEAGEQVLNQTRSAVEALDKVLANQEATAETLEAALQAQRAQARSRLAAAEQAAAEARAQMNSAKSARDAASRAHSDTPRRQAGLRAQRLRTLTQRTAAYNATRVAYNARQAAYAAQQQVFDALPPVSALMVAADSAVGVLRTQVTNAKTSFEQLTAKYTRLIESIASGAPPLTIESAEFHGDLEDMIRGRGVQWKIAGLFTGEHFLLDKLLSFSDVDEAVAQILQSLIRG